ncbi:CCA tRNA nucleotidyltransferase [Bombilactobacillus folatiphilus]|uniref:CCA-adding enzyme n=1 Tax=Bombilactobacillus folatiphilus TaxID=2923362 RepID=A0ABY4PAS8_9LACO|nr:CCA tRNA nucleotidyltransferase [Bombilactobacillus folatiphilus]UQS82778.1 CCA tRNA nucleotidyltransferase [Bombilactobacillus folatiphilus]
MIIEHFPMALQAAIPILEKINAAGFEAYFVGGCVRDTLLDHQIHDVDLATSAYPQEVKMLFPHTADTGIEHGTVTIITDEQNYEITTFRTESGYQDYRRPQHVEFVRSLTEDLKRRDFTINALAMRTDGQVIDLFGGVQDLSQKKIKAVGQAAERFHEDALRMVRAVRFQAQLGFEIESQTKMGIQLNALLLKKIAVERIRDEWLKLMQGRAWQAGLTTMLQTKLYQYCPQLIAEDLNGLLKLPAVKLSSEKQVWTLVCWCLQFSEQRIKTVLKSWKTANDVQKIVLASVNLLNQAEVTAWNLYQASPGVVTNCLAILNLLGKTTLANELQQQYEQLPIKNVRELAVNGRDLMSELKMPAGPQLGQTLLWIQQQVVAQQLVNQKAVIINELKNRYAQRGR